jgi:hypothetical protein
MEEQPVPMPAELVAALGRLEETAANIAGANWERIGGEGRALYKQYVDGVRSKRRRRKRADLAALQLLTPDHRIPVFNSGGFWKGR